MRRGRGRGTRLGIGTSGHGLLLGLAAGLVALVVAACSSGATASGSGGPGGGGSGPGDTGIALPSVALAEGHQPSGAKVRVFNAYSPVTFAPGPVDVYLDPTIDASSKPVVSIPYGTLSAFFDPTQVDAAGDTSLTFLPAGVTDGTKQLISQAAVVKPGDVLTILLTTGSQLQDGSFGGQTNVYLNAPPADSGIASPPAGKGLLIVVSSGLDQTLASPDAQDWYVSFGHGCDPGLGNDAASIATVSPGTTGTPFVMAPGQVKVTIHGGDPNGQADCSTPPIASATVTAKAGVTDVLLLYGSDAGVKAEMIPLE